MRHNRKCVDLQKKFSLKYIGLEWGKVSVRPSFCIKCFLMFNTMTWWRRWATQLIFEERGKKGYISTCNVRSCRLLYSLSPKFPVVSGQSLGIYIFTLTWRESIHDTETILCSLHWRSSYMNNDVPVLKLNLLVQFFTRLLGFKCIQLLSLL